MPVTTPEQAFDALLRAQPSRPFVTYYNDAADSPGAGERSELSVRSLGNWVAKTHFLLSDALGLGVGDSALIALPAHWISVPILLGCLSAGLELRADGAAEVAFVAPQTAGAAGQADEAFGIDPAHAAVGFRGAAPAEFADYVEQVRPQPDAWGSVHPPAAATDPALGGWTRAGLLAAATARAGELGLDAGGRLLASAPWGGAAGWLDSVFAPLAVGGSVVLVHGADDATLDRRFEQERCTARVD